MPLITLNNRYQYNPDTDLLGIGGIGVVYKAYDNERKCYVAIKEFNVTSNLKYSLQEEFQKSITFWHGNLVHSYDFFSISFVAPNGRTHETQYGVMELIEGGDLLSYLQTQPPLPQLLEVVKGILQGLRYLHTRDPKTDKGVIIHRDIKPTNILIYRNSENQPIPKIADFNIAKETSTDLSTQTVVGTPEYMSPEQFLPRTYGTDGKVLPNTDLWSLGVLLCDHLLKRSMFGKRSNGDTQGEITHNILNLSIPTSDIQKLPSPFNHIIGACLVRHAPQRIQSADALLTLINSAEDTIEIQSQAEDTLIVDTKPPKVGVQPPLEGDTPKQPRQAEYKNDWVIISIIAIVLVIFSAYIVVYDFNNTTPNPESELVEVDTTTIAATPPPSNIDTPAQPEADTDVEYQQNVNTGNDLFVQGKYAEAKAQYEAALQLQPNSKVASANIKRCEELLKPKPSGTAFPEQTEAPKPESVVPATTSRGSNTDPFAAQMVLIQGGTFTMGSNDGESDEKPEHQVSVSSFKMSKYEVTQAQWEAIMGNNPSEFSGCAQCPVERVNWNDIQDFLQKLNAKTGKNYRLPTEAEWEYAAGNGSHHTKYAWGNGNPTQSKGGNVADETKRPSDGVAWSTKFEGYTDSYWFTAPVGQFDANDFGLYDMTGNVWEWCRDWYASDYYSKSPSRNPENTTSATFRVVRGGAWNASPQVSRVASRFNDSPAYRAYNLGFRLALSSQF